MALLTAKSGLASYRCGVDERAHLAINCLCFHTRPFLLLHLTESQSHMADRSQNQTLCKAVEQALTKVKRHARPKDEQCGLQALYLLAGTSTLISSGKQNSRRAAHVRVRGQSILLHHNTFMARPVLASESSRKLAKQCPNQMAST